MLMAFSAGSGYSRQRIRAPVDFCHASFFVTASGFAHVLERKVCALARACLSTRVMNAYVLPGHLCRM